MRFLLILMGLFLTGCQMALPLPDVAIPTDPMPKISHSRPMALASSKIDLKRGTPYIAYPYFRWSFDHVDISWLDICNGSVRQRFSNSLVQWSADDQKFGGWGGEAEKFVAPSLRQMGYEFLTSNDSAFQQKSRKKRAELLLSATITDIKSNMCQVFNFFYFKNADIIAGNMWVRVKWEVYDTLSDRVVGTFETEGLSVVEKPTEAGNELLILRALENAAEQLGYRSDFQKVVGAGPSLKKLKQTEQKQSPIVLTGGEKQTDKPLYDNVGRVKQALVSIDDDATGFYIASDGYILTTLDAVGEADHISVQDHNGTRYIANVIRRNSRLKIALLHVDVVRHAYLTLAAEELLKPMTEVFTMGNPSDYSARDMIMRGMVSSLKSISSQDFSQIQVSILTSDGFGGAPLLDEYGRVLGVHDGYPKQDGHLANYVPIWDIVRAMNLSWQ